MANKIEEEDEIVGTEYYISPEMIETRQCSFAGDLWAFGVILYQFFTIQVPFKGKCQEITMEKISKGQYEMPKSIPLVAQDLIRQLYPGLRVKLVQCPNIIQRHFLVINLQGEFLASVQL